MGNLLGSPEKDGAEEGDPDDDGFPVGLAGARLDVKTEFLGLEREENHQDDPRDNDHHKDVRDHVRSPACESHVEACLAEELDCRGIWRSTDGCSDTSDVGCHRDRERETDLSLVIVRKTAKDRSEQGKHHCGSGSVAHEHGEQGDDDQECQKNGPGFLERFQEKTRKGDIQTIFGSHVGQYESTEEKHDDRIRESRHYALVRYKLTGIRSA